MTGRFMTPSEKLAVATYQAGFASLYALECGRGDVVKITIVPTANALGYTQWKPAADDVPSIDDLRKQITVCFAGQIAERKIAGAEPNTGASDSLKLADQLAARFVELTQTAADFENPPGELAMQERRMSVLRECRTEAEALVDKHADTIRRLADVLVLKETITGDEAMAIFAG